MNIQELIFSNDKYSHLQRWLDRIFATFAEHMPDLRFNYPQQDGTLSRFPVALRPVAGVAVDAEGMAAKRFDVLLAVVRPAPAADDPQAWLSPEGGVDVERAGQLVIRINPAAGVVGCAFCAEGAAEYEAVDYEAPDRFYAVRMFEKFPPATFEAAATLPPHEWPLSSAR